jgi:hypothetical protein
LFGNEKLLDKTFFVFGITGRIFVSAKYSAENVFGRSLRMAHAAVKEGKGLGAQKTNFMFSLAERSICPQKTTGIIKVLFFYFPTILTPLSLSLSEFTLSH